MQCTNVLFCFILTYKEVPRHQRDTGMGILTILVATKFSLAGVSSTIISETMEVNGLMTTENDHASEELGTQVELDSSHYHNGTEIMIGTLDDEYLWIIGCH